MSKARKIIIGLIIFLFALAGIVYGGGVYYFSLHYLPGTVINGIDCSFMEVSDVQQIMKEQAKVYVIAIDERNNGREKLTAEQVGLRYRPKNRLEEFLKKQQKWRWFLELTNSFVLDKTACVEYDEEMLKKSIQQLRCMQESEITPVRNASIIRKEKVFEAVPEVEGDELDFQKTEAAIGNAITAGKIEVSLEKEGCYKEPVIRVSDQAFTDNLSRLNKMMGTIVTYDFGKKSERVDYKLIGDWITESETGEYNINRGMVAAYVINLSQKYDEIGKEFEFRTYDLRTITVAAANMGWVIDKEAETNALMQDIENGTIAVREPVYARRGIDRREDGAGDTYVEIDLNAQRMVLYKDGKLALDTPVVSGNISEGFSTPTGCFPIREKATDIAIASEAREVSYWISFTSNLGIVDAPWREDFGGDLYTLIGSQGNIEAPLDAARTVYENLDEGDPVIIYN